MSRSTGDSVSISESNWTSDTIGGIQTNYGNLILYCTTIPIGIFIISAFFRSTDSIFENINNRLNTFGTLILVLGVYLSYMATVQGNSYTSIQTTFTIADRCKTALNNAIVSNAKSCPEFMNTLHFSFHKNISSYKEYIIDESVPDDYNAITFICTTLYQAIEDYLNTIGLTFFTNSSMITTFMSYFVSPKVQEHWYQHQHKYDFWLRVFIQDLINAIKVNNFQSPTELECYVFGYVKSDKFLLIKGLLATPLTE